MADRVNRALADTVEASGKEVNVSGQPLTRQDYDALVAVVSYSPIQTNPVATASELHLCVRGPTFSVTDACGRSHPRR